MGDVRGGAASGLRCIIGAGEYPIIATSKRAACVALFALVAAMALAVSSEVGFSRSVTPGLVKHLQGRFGEGVRQRLENWKNLVQRVAGRPERPRGPAGEREVLRLVNEFFNRVPSQTDMELWGVEEYWATPAETLAINGADCEDYAFSKYFTLKELGLPVARLRLVYARNTRLNEAHMVLAYYPDPGADPLILDILEGDIRVASDRTDLIPVYSFNDDDLQFLQQGAPPLLLEASSHRKWRDFLRRLQRELSY